MRIKRRRKYRYALTEDLLLSVELALPEFENEWLSVTLADDKTGMSLIVVKPGYAWDGCSPAWTVADLFWIGTPDGIIDYRTGKPLTYSASCVHDALCQFKAVPRKAADTIFKTLLEMFGFRLSGLYYFGVRAFAVLTGKK